MTLEEKEKSIIEHYGLNPQLKYIQTEIFELNEAIIKYKVAEEENVISSALGEPPIWNMEKLKEDIMEEMADVQMMLGQFKVHFDIKDEEIDKIMNFKADRQLKRIEQEKGR